MADSPERMRRDAAEDHHALYTYTKYMGWFRFFLGVIAAIAVSVMLTVYIERNNQVAACKRNSALKRTLMQAERGKPQIVKAIKLTIPTSCDDAFPPPIPFIR